MQSYVKFRARSDKFVLSCQNDACGEVDDAVGTSAQQIVPYAAGGLHARKDMGEPGQHPGDDEDYQVHLLKTFKDLLELLILVVEQREHH